MAQVPEATPKKKSHFPGWELLDQAVVSGARFLMMILVAKGGSQESLGLYSTGLNIFVLGLAIQESFLTTPFIILLPRMEQDDQARYAGNTFLLSILLSCITAATLLLGAWTFGWNIFGSETAWVITSLAIFIPFQLFREFNRRWLFLSRRSKQAAISDAIYVAVQLAGIGCLAYYRCLTAFSAMTMIGVTSLLLSGAMYAGIRRDIHIDTSKLLDDFRRNVHVGRWFAGTNLISVLQTNLVALAILKQLGSVTAGTYAACMSIAMLANPFLLAITSALAPAASRLQVSHGPSSVRSLTIKYAIATTIVMSLFTLGLLLVGDRLLGIAFKQEYQGNQYALTLASCNMIGLGLCYTVSCGLRAMDLHRADLIGAAVGLMVTAGMLLSATLTIEHGIWSLFLGVIATAGVRWIAFFFPRQSTQSR